MSDVVAWLCSSELGRDKLSLLVLCVQSMSVLAVNLSWRTRPGQSWSGRWAVQGVRLCYYVGVPYAVLWRGALLSQMGIPTTATGEHAFGLAFELLGLSGAQDMLTIGRGLVLVVGTLVLLVALWIWYARAARGLFASDPSVPWWVALREALFYQVQWAFYRGFVALFTANPVHIAFGGVALAVLPWFLDPRRRHDLFTSHGHLVVQDWVYVLLAGYLSLSVHVLWLFVAAHTLWLWVSGRVLARSFPRETAGNWLAGSS